LCDDIKKLTLHKLAYTKLLRNLFHMQWKKVVDVSLYLNIQKKLLLYMSLIIVFMHCFLVCAQTIGNVSLL